MEREALKLALKDLKWVDNWLCEKPMPECVAKLRKAITAIKEALAQPAQEPVALVVDGVLVKSALPEKYTGHLYTTPPQRTWIWLSDADIAEVVDTTCQYVGSYEEFLIKKTERKIRSMNT